MRILGNFFLGGTAVDISSGFSNVISCNVFETTTVQFKPTDPAHVIQALTFAGNTLNRTRVILDKNVGAIRGVEIIGGSSWRSPGHGFQLIGVENSVIGGGLTVQSAGYGSGVTSYNAIQLEDCLNTIINGLRAFDPESPKTQGYGVNETGASNRTQVLNSNLRDNAIGALSLVGSESYGRDVLGYNPVGYISPDPTWGTSPWTYTNKDTVREDIYITVASPGDVSAITKNGQNLPLPGTEPTYICQLEPGESITITYTTAGTLKRFGW